MDTTPVESHPMVAGIVEPLDPIVEVPITCAPPSKVTAVPGTTAVKPIVAAREITSIAVNAEPTLAILNVPVDWFVVASVLNPVMVPPLVVSVEGAAALHIK